MAQKFHMSVLDVKLWYEMMVIIAPTLQQNWIWCPQTSFEICFVHLYFTPLSCPPSPPQKNMYVASLQNIMLLYIC